MTTNIHVLLAKSTSRLLKPLIRLLLRYGVAYGTFAEWVRLTYVEAAYDELKSQGQKVTISNISALSGLTRKEAKRLSVLEDNETDTANLRFNRAARVISGWKNNPQFQTDSGQPAPLSMDAKGSPSFAELVKQYSGDMTTISMLDILKAANCVAHTGDQVTLIKEAYIPQGESTPSDKINILGNDVAELVSTISYNLQAPANQLRFQRKVFHTALDSAHLEKFQQFSTNQSQKLLEKLNEWLNQHQLQPDSPGKSHYVSVGIYRYEQPNQENPS